MHPHPRPACTPTCHAPGSLPGKALAQPSSPTPMEAPPASKAPLLTRLEPSSPPPPPPRAHVTASASGQVPLLLPHLTSPPLQMLQALTSASTELRGVFPAHGAPRTRPSPSPRPRLVALHTATEGRAPALHPGPCSPSLGPLQAACPSTCRTCGTNSLSQEKPLGSPRQPCTDPCFLPPPSTEHQSPRAQSLSHLQGPTVASTQQEGSGCPCVQVTGTRPSDPRGKQLPLLLDEAWGPAGDGTSSSCVVTRHHLVTHQAARCPRGHTSTCQRPPLEVPALCPESSLPRMSHALGGCYQTVVPTRPPSLGHLMSLERTAPQVCCLLRPGLLALGRPRPSQGGPAAFQTSPTLESGPPFLCTQLASDTSSRVVRGSVHPSLTPEAPPASWTMASGSLPLPAPLLPRPGTVP